MLLYFLRHGEPIYNPDKLTEYGILQAEALSKRLVLSGIDEIYSSSSNRVIMTAQPLADALKKEIRILDFANEKYLFRDMAVDEDGSMDWFFMKEKYIKALLSDEVRSLNDKWYEHKFFKNTSIEYCIKRVSQSSDDFLMSLGYEHDKKNHYFITYINQIKNELLCLHMLDFQECSYRIY